MLRKLIAFPFVVTGVLGITIGSVFVYGLKNTTDILEDISNVYERYDKQ